MKKQMLFLLVAGLIGHTLHTFNRRETSEKPLPFATHALLIFLDDSEKNIQAISANLVVALSQKAAPILASTSLFTAIENNPTLADLSRRDNEYAPLETYYTKVTNKIAELIEAKSKELSLKDQEEIVSQLNKEFPQIPATPFSLSRVDRALMRQNLSWNPDDWITKIADTEQRLLLLIPKDYINSGTSFDLKPYKPLPKKLNINDPLTITEYHTGLKIDHMETIKNYRDAFPKEFTPKEYADYFMQAVWPRKVGANCSDIFVSNAEYAQAKIESPRWVIYADGHGQIENEKKQLKHHTFGLSFDMFMQFLDFMNTKIHTSIFVYTSCFAVGTNIERIYKDERQLAKTYSFIIVTQGVTDSILQSTTGLPLTNFKVRDINFTNKKLQMAPESDYVGFIKNFTTVPEIANFESAISPIMSSELKSGILEVPHIRLKSKDFFNIADVTNKIAIMGNVFAKTCTKVDLPKYFIKKGIVPKYYLVYAPNIPCELIIPSLPEAKPNFIPMFFPQLWIDRHAPSFEYHIAKITAPNLSLDNIINMFIDAIPITNYVGIKIDDLYIQAGGLFKSEQMVSLKDVIIESGPDIGYKYIDCYFMYNNMPYEIGDNGKPAVPVSIHVYNRLKSKRLSLDRPEKFEAISELQKTRLQKLQKTKAQEGVGK